jgi:hypothetical protein
LKDVFVSYKVFCLIMIGGEKQIMKVMVRNIFKILPGKMTEGMELVQTWMAVASRLLGTSSRGYQPFIGGGDTTRTIIWEIELDSFTAFEALPVKMGADPEMQTLFPKLNVVIDSIDVELYTPIPTM